MTETTPLFPFVGVAVRRPAGARVRSESHVQRGAMQTLIARILSRGVAVSGSAKNAGQLLSLLKAPLRVHAFAFFTRSQKQRVIRSIGILTAMICSSRRRVTVLRPSSIVALVNLVTIRLNILPLAVSDNFSSLDIQRRA